MKQIRRSSELECAILENGQLNTAFFSDLKRLPSMADGEFMLHFSRILTPLEFDFRKEEQWMEDIDFSSLKEHRALHAEVLGVLHKAQARVMTGDFGLARRAVELLPEWLADHVLTMDVPLTAVLRAAAKHEPQPDPMLDAA